MAVLARLRLFLKHFLYGNGAAKGTDRVDNWRVLGMELLGPNRCLAAKRQLVGGGLVTHVVPL